VADIPLVSRYVTNMNNNKLFVGNLSFKMNEEDIRDLFAAHGNVVSVSVPVDTATGRKRGFAFVEG
jgi:RNA recognition motif-containing protein